MPWKLNAKDVHIGDMPSYAMQLGASKYYERLLVGMICVNRYISDDTAVDVALRGFGFKNRWDYKGSYPGNGKVENKNTIQFIKSVHVDPDDRLPCFLSLTNIQFSSPEEWFLNNCAEYFFKGGIIQLCPTTIQMVTVFGNGVYTTKLRYLCSDWNGE